MSGAHSVQQTSLQQSPGRRDQNSWACILCPLTTPDSVRAAWPVLLAHQQYLTFWGKDSDHQDCLNSQKRLDLLPAPIKLTLPPSSSSKLGTQASQAVTCGPHTGSVGDVLLSACHIVHHCQHIFRNV